jgi:hypothetical protein
MGFGRKKQTTPTNVNQTNVAFLATESLSRQRAIRLLLVVRIVLTSPMLMHRWTQKAVVQMLSKMTGLSLPRAKKDLTNEYEASWYRNVDGNLALPCRIIKAAIVEGAIGTGGVVSKAQLNRELRVRGYTTPIALPKGKNISMDVAQACGVKMDVAIASNNGTPDLRARALVPSGAWFEVVLDFPPTLTPDMVMSALTSAGDYIGLCDNRPERGGEYGTFEVPGNYIRSDAVNIRRVLAACSKPEEKFEIPPELLRAANALHGDGLSDLEAKARNVANRSAKKRVA